MSALLRRLPSPSVLAALMLLLLARPYEGIRHDGVLYFGQALRRSLVPGLSADPFFSGGSQDTFSAYSLLLAPLYRIVGPAFTHQTLLLIGLLASACVVWQLSRRWGLAPIWGLLALAVMSPLYGGLRKFSVTENSLTARSLAEPLVLASLLPLARGQLLLGTLWQLAAALFHPLMALPGLVVTWLLAVQRDRRWLLLIALPLATAALVQAGVITLKAVTAVYDPFWWSQVYGANVQVVLSNWTLSDALTLLTDTALLAVVARGYWLPNEGRKLLQVVVVATVGLLTVHAVGTDLLHSVLLTQLQPWRILWLTHLLATVLAPYLIWQTWQRGGLTRLGAALLALAVMSNHAGSPYTAPLLVGWVLLIWAASRGLRVSPHVTTVAVAFSGVLLLALAGMRLWLELDRLHWRPPTWPMLDIASHVITAPLLTFAFAGLALCWWPHSAPWRRAGLALSLLGLVAAVTLWDRRDALDRAIESASTPTPFASQIPVDASVFWPEQLAGTWGLIQRASHYNRQQGAGMLFNRATAELMAPRRAAYEAIRDDFERCETSAFFSNSPPQLAGCPTPNLARLHQLCAGPVRPDYLIFEQALSIPPLSTATVGNVALRLYSCTQLGSPTAARH